MMMVPNANPHLVMAESLDEIEIIFQPIMAWVEKRNKLEELVMFPYCCMPISDEAVIWDLRTNEWWDHEDQSWGKGSDDLLNHWRDMRRAKKVS